MLYCILAKYPGLTKYLEKGEHSMYCNACGKPNPDGSAFCSSCGKPLDPTSTVQPTPAQSVRPSTQPISKPAGTTVLTDFRSHFRKSWREFATTPLALALIICHSVGVLLNFIDLDTTMESMEVLLDTLNALNSSQTGSGNFVMTLMQILLIAPGVLTALGLWMLYMDARDQSSRPINVTGLKVIMGLQSTTMVLYCLYVFVLFCTSCSAAQELSGNGYLASAARTAINTAMAVVVIVGGLGIAFFWLTIKFIISVRDCAECCEPDTKYVKGFAVLEFISGGLSALIMLSYGITLSMVVSCALPFLFGVILLKYKDLMETLSWEQANFEAQYEATQTVQSQYIPTWKRMEMEKKSADAWYCINCGSHNDPDAICCSKCGGTERQ